MQGIKTGVNLRCFLDKTFSSSYLLENMTDKVIKKRCITYQKMHGTGNDFIHINAFRKKTPNFQEKYYIKFFLRTLKLDTSALAVMV